MAKRHEIVLILCDDQASEKLNCEIKKIKTWNIPGLPAIPSFKAIFRNMQQFDLCHLHYSAFLGEMVGISCKLRKVPLITTFHDETKRGSHKAIYDRISLLLMSKLSDKIICLSESMKKVLTRRGLKEEKIAIIPNAFHVKTLQEHVKNLKKIKTKRDSILFVGRLEERKGPHYLLKALSHLREKGIRPKLTIVAKERKKTNLLPM